MQTYNVSRLPSMITLGYDGENNWRPIAFDCSALLAGHSDGVVTLWLLPKGAAQAFPVALERVGNTVVWTPLNEEMTEEHGQLQVVVQDGTDVGKSKVVDYTVHDSLVGGADHPAENPSWAVQVVADVTEQADRAEAAAESIDPEAIEETVADAVADYLIEHPVEAPVTSVNGKTGAVSLTASDVHALPDSTVIPAAVTEHDVAGWGFTKNTGTYSKPSGGIPASDLASGVIPDVSGKQDAPLIGQAYDSTAANYVTPAQVAAAIGAGKDVIVIVMARDVFDDIPFQITFSDFACPKDRVTAQTGSLLNAVIANTVLRYNGVWFMFTLTGTITYQGQAVGTWGIAQGTLPLNFDPSDLAAVATSGSYDDLTDKPSIPSLSGYATQTWVGQQGYQTAQQVQTAISPLQPKAITDTGGYYTTDTVEGALQEIGAELAGINTLIGSGVIT